MADPRPSPARLRAVSRAFLDADAPAPRHLVVLGLDADGGAEATHRGLMEALVGLGVGRAVDAPLRVTSLGPVGPDHLDVLLPPRGRRGAHTLLVCLPRIRPGGLRVAHQLGLWRWSLGARHLRCLWPGPRGAARDIATGLGERLAWAGEEIPVEVLAAPGGWGDAAHHRLLGQVVLSTLNASRSRPPARGARGLQGSGD